MQIQSSAIYASEKTKNNVNPTTNSAEDVFRPDQVFVRDLPNETDCFDRIAHNGIKIEDGSRNGSFDVSESQRVRHASSQSSASRDSLFGVHSEAMNLCTSIRVSGLSEDFDDNSCAATSSNSMTSAPHLKDPMIGMDVNDIVNHHSDETTNTNNSLNSHLLNAGPMQNSREGETIKTAHDPGVVRRSPPPPNVTLNPEKHKRNTMPTGILRILDFLFFVPELFRRRKVGLRIPCIIKHKIFPCMQFFSIVVCAFIVSFLRPQI